MTQEQLRKIRNAGYKYWDNEVYDNHPDWSKREISQFSFEAGAKYALANKYDELKEDAKKNGKPNIVQFLKDNGVYEMFFANLFGQRNREVLSQYFLFCFFDTNAISSAFIWEETPEGQTFWNEISDIWCKQF